MRILHCVELYRPSVGGAQEVVRQISERLVAAGHDVTVATSALAERRSHEEAGVRIESFTVSGNAVRGMSGEVERYQRFVSDGGFDVVMTYAAQQWTTDALLGRVGQIEAKVFLAPCGFSGLYDPAYAGYFEALPEQLAEFDGLIFHSDTYRDIEFARRHGLGNVVVIPNGADEREFAEDARASGAEFRRDHRIDDDVPVLLSVGSHTGLKGHATAITALREVDVPRAVLVIAGNTPHGPGCLRNCQVRAAVVRVASRGRKQVVLLDGARADTLAAYGAADLFVFASNIEASPIVLYEAAAAATPFLTADVGNSAEITEWTGGGELLPTEHLADGRSIVEPRVLAEGATALLRDPERRAELGAAGRAAFEGEFSWEKIARRYEDLYGLP